MKGTLLDYFHFTRSERRGLFVLLLFIIGIFAYPYVVKMIGGDGDGGAYNFSEFDGDISEWESGLIERDSMGWKKRNSYPKWKKKKKKNYKEYGKDDTKTKVKITPFSFDPNQADKSTFLELGLPERVVNTLLNFRNKGGRFYKKEDLKKVYGLKAEWYEQLAPHIQIKRAPKNNGGPPTAEIPAEYNQPDFSYTKLDNTSKTKREYKPVILDINTATEEEFQQIRGIGPYYSKKIVRFRELLGGYHSIAQVGEVRGLPDSTYQAILPSLKLNTPSIRKLNINTVSAEELKGHPYVRWKTANAIIKYRETHGTFADIEALKKVYAVSPELYGKLSPYLSASD